MSETKFISLDLIDDPQIAMRLNAHDSGIEELAADMQKVGLIEPIVVRPVNGRYEIIAGHRRTCAARILGWTTIEAKIVEVDDEEALRMRMIENLSRRDTDPVDEAVFVAEIMQRYDLGVEDVARMLGRSEEWVMTRLEVFDMPDYLQNYLRTRQISLGAALWLARIENEEDRRYYSHFAAQNGVSVASARRWCLELNSGRLQTAEEKEQVIIQGEAVEVQPKLVACAKCGQPVPLVETDLVYIHRGGVCPPSEGGE